MPYTHQMCPEVTGGPELSENGVVGLRGVMIIFLGMSGGVRHWDTLYIS